VDQRFSEATYAEFEAAATEYLSKPESISPTYTPRRETSSPGNWLTR